MYVSSYLAALHTYLSFTVFFNWKDPGENCFL